MNTYQHCVSGINTSVLIVFYKSSHACSDFPSHVNICVNLTSFAGFKTFRTAAMSSRWHPPWHLSATSFVCVAYQVSSSGVRYIVCQMCVACQCSMWKEFIHLQVNLLLTFGCCLLCDRTLIMTPFMLRCRVRCLGPIVLL